MGKLPLRSARDDWKLYIFVNTSSQLCQVVHVPGDSEGGAARGFEVSFLTARAGFAPENSLVRLRDPAAGNRRQHPNGTDDVLESVRPLSGRARCDPA
jgi:hypothetical protein